jgi:hypothetical protein
MEAPEVPDVFAAAEPAAAGLLELADELPVELLELLQAATAVSASTATAGMANIAFPGIAFPIFLPLELSLFRRVAGWIS